MRGGAGGGGDALALEIGKGLDLVAHPQLRGGELDRVGEEHLALTARREVGDDRARREHVEAAADHGLEQLQSGLEQLEFGLEPVLVEGAEMVGEPHLAIDGQRVQVADADLGLGLRDGRRADGRDAGQGAGALQECSAVDDHGFPPLRLDQVIAVRAAAPAAAYSCMTRSRTWARSSPNSGLSCSALGARIGETAP